MAIYTRLRMPCKLNSQHYRLLTDPIKFYNENLFKLLIFFIRKDNMIYSIKVSVSILFWFESSWSFWNVKLIHKFSKLIKKALLCHPLTCLSIRERESQFCLCQPVLTLYLHGFDNSKDSAWRSKFLCCFNFPTRQTRK